MDTSSTSRHLRRPCLALLCLLSAAQAQEAPEPWGLNDPGYALGGAASPVCEAYAAEADGRRHAPLAFQHTAPGRPSPNARAAGRWGPTEGTPLWRPAKAPAPRSRITSLLPMDDGGFFVEVELKY